MGLPTILWDDVVLGALHEDGGSSFNIRFLDNVRINLYLLQFLRRTELSFFDSSSIDGSPPKTLEFSNCGGIPLSGATAPKGDDVGESRDAFESRKQ